MNTSPASGKVRTSATVVNCYDFFDRVFPACGLRDLTDGMYEGDATRSHEAAQARQIEWLLDQVHCDGPGFQLLDIGCGYGRLVEAATKRGATAIGITISPAQVRRCRAAGLDVRLLNYRRLHQHWHGEFDGIVANGSIEHFVQPADIRAGRDDEIYHELFEICGQLLKPGLPRRRFVTTVIHRHDQSPQISRSDLQRSPWSFRWGSAEFHYAMLQQAFGGFYPQPGQLVRCARPHFRLIGEVDGTWDYHITSEQCCERLRAALHSSQTGPRIWRQLGSYLLQNPQQALAMACCWLGPQSWPWQFRGPQPPTQLLRQVWELQK